MNLFFLIHHSLNKRNRVDKNEKSGTIQTIETILFTENKSAKSFEKKNNKKHDITVNTIDNKKLKESMFMASSSLLGRKIANSYLPDITTVKKEDKAINDAKLPNSSGENNLVIKGEIRIGIV